jgi:hypothetical protein
VAPQAADAEGGEVLLDRRAVLADGLLHGPGEGGSRTATPPRGEDVRREVIAEEGQALG